MRATVAETMGHRHEATEYEVVRVQLPFGPAAALADGIVVVARTDDAAADFRAARNYLEELGLLDCSCCGLKKETTGA